MDWHAHGKIEETFKRSILGFCFLNRGNIRLLQLMDQAQAQTNYAGFFCSALIPALVDIDASDFTLPAPGFGSQRVIGVIP